MKSCVETQQLTFLGLTLSDHEGANLCVWQLQQLLCLVPAQPFEQPAGKEKDSYERPGPCHGNQDQLT